MEIFIGLIFDKEHKNWSEDLEECKAFLTEALIRIKYESAYYACGPIWLTNVLEEFQKFGFCIDDVLISGVAYVFGWYIDEWDDEAITKTWYDDHCLIAIKGFHLMDELAMMGGY